MELTAPPLPYRTHALPGIGGRIRRLIELKEPVSLALNRRVEFEPGAIRIEEAQSDVPA